MNYGDIWDSTKKKDTFKNQQLQQNQMLALLSNKFVIALLVLAHVTNALHFYVKTGETKCFFEELQEDTLVVGRIDAYEKNDHSNDYLKNKNLQVQITIDVCIILWDKECKCLYFTPMIIILTMI